MASALELYLMASRSSQPPVSAFTSAVSYTAASSASAQDITDTWTIPAYDPLAGTVYELETQGGGTWEGQTLTLGVSLDGASPSAQMTVGGGFFSSGAGFNLTWRCRVLCTVTGSSGTFEVSTSGLLAVQGANLSSGANNNNAAIAGPTGAHTVSTLTSHTLALTAQWGATAAGETLTAYGSVFSRWGS